MQHLIARNGLRTPLVYGRTMYIPSSGFATPPPAPDRQPPRFEEKKSKFGSRLFFALFGATAITSATVALANYSSDFRDILKEYAPWADEAVAIINSEKENPVSKAITGTREMVSSASDMIFGSSSAPPPSPQPSSPPSKSVSPPSMLPPLPKIDPPVTSSAKKVEAPPKKVPVSKPPEPVIQKTEVIPPKIEKFDSPEAAETMESACKASVAAYRRATEALKMYAKRIDILLENYTDEVNQNVLDEIKRVAVSLTEAEDAIETSNKRLEAALGGSESSLADKIRKEVSSAREDHNKAASHASVFRRYWSQVEQARKYFVDELQAIYPEVDVTSQKFDMRGGNPDLLLLIALRRILLYQQMLARQDTIMSQNIENAMSGKDDDIIRAKVNVELEKERRNLSLSYQKKDAATRAKIQREYETQLKKQIDIHASHLQDALDARAKQVAEEERRAADEKAEAQRASQELRLAAVIGRLQGVDDALKAVDDDLKARSDADKMARQSQKLWAACEAFDSALRRDDSSPVPLTKELDAIASAAAESDELVTAVLRGVSKVARERGIFSEVVLKERFNRVENVCKKLALVPEEGGSLVVYFLSWMQSIFLIKGSGIPKAEIEDGVTDFSELDTHDILQRVRYWVERCEWAKALRYINLLRGAPSCVAKDWANEVTLYLEARQAARALLAHASASGLLHL